MKMWSLTKERKDEILKQRDLKIQELKLLKEKTKEDLWSDDLETFMTEVRNEETCKPIIYQYEPVFSHI